MDMHMLLPSVYAMMYGVLPHSPALQAHAIYWFANELGKKLFGLMQ